MRSRVSLTKSSAEIRAREGRGLVELPPPLAPGARVRVTRGPLAGLDGLCVGLGPRQRVYILLALLGAARQITFPTANVEAVR